MSDSNVKKAQVYLNSMFGGHSEWVKLEENGNTGTATIKGIIRAFQIQNNVAVAGVVGPATLAKMKALPKISKMSPSDTPLINVCLIQCALFCKGYNAGGVTGIYYTTGVNAIKELQNDANIGETGVIDWKVWSALLSFNWFKKPAFSGTEVLRTIQRQLNKDYSDYINVRACDGIMSRETAQSLLGALQAEEGILSSSDTLTNLNELNFGDETIRRFPGPLKIGNTKTAFNKLIQYGLFFNGYYPNRYDGVFDAATEAAVANFQKFYGLSEVIADKSGEVGYQTMMSLLISRGDTSRPAFACDCSTILNTQQAKDLKAANYTVVGRYLTGTVGGKTSKALTVAEIKRITNAGLKIFPIYQDGGYYLNYFKNPNRGYSDATIAIKAAKRLGFPFEATIYFAVDFDCLPQDTDNYIMDYFTQINTVFSDPLLNSNCYKVGIYGPRQVCSKMYETQRASSSFVSDMSRGFTGNCGYPIPQNWSFDQFAEMEFSSSPNFAIDKDAISKNPEADQGCLNFETVSNTTNTERIENLRIKYLQKFTSVMAIVDNMFTYKFDFTAKKIPMGKILCGPLEITTSLSANTILSLHPDSTSEALIEITVDDNGEVTQNFKTHIENLLSQLSFESAVSIKDHVKSKTYEIAQEMGCGSISIKLEIKTLNSCELSIGWQSNELSLPSDEDGNPPQNNITLSITYIMEITIHPDYHFEEATEVDKIAALGIACGIITVSIIFAAATGGLSLGSLATVSVTLPEAVQAFQSLGLIVQG